MIISKCCGYKPTEVLQVDIAQTEIDRIANLRRKRREFYEKKIKAGQNVQTRDDFEIKRHSNIALVQTSKRKSKSKPRRLEKEF